MNRGKAIIAVFGGDDSRAIAFATRLGAEVATQKQIVLTGGDTPGHDAVKNAALLGAANAPWIGVQRGKKSTWIPQGAHCVIVTTLGHKRNFLEACLCDAAIVL